MRRILVTRHGRPQDMSIVDGPSPKPAPGEVLVGVHAIGLNFPDLLVISGKYQTIPPFPYAPGKEVAGRVLAVGAGVERFKTGDRVMAQIENGGYAEEIVAPERHCFAMPAGLSMTKAAAMGLAYSTSWFGVVVRGQFQPGETVLVTGAAGGCGIAAVQIARALGGRVVGVVSSQAKAEFILSQGADHAIVAGGRDMRETLRAEVHALNGGRGADIVFDPVGGDLFDAALRALGWNGRAVVCGFAGGGPNLVRSNYLLIKQISVSGLHASDYRDYRPEMLQDAMTRLFALVELGRLDPPVAAVYPFEDYAAALDEIASRRVMGKVVLETGRTDCEAPHAA